MTQSWKYSAFQSLSLVLGLLASGTDALAARNGTCTKLNQRKAWHTLTDDEKSAYITAEKCLMSSPPKLGTIEGAKNRWDELHWVHIHTSNIIHGVGEFLPWHRYYMRLHEHLLQTECNYTGAQPYWDEQRDATLSASVADASVWGDDEQLSFGTNGRGGDGCVVDGPFANTTLHLSQEWGVANYTSYCLSRDFTDENWVYANTTYSDACFAKANYSDVWSCWSKYPHISAHASVGGTMLDQAASPGDPIFFLHHTNLDRLWWEWQAQDLPARLYEMSGRSIPKLSSLLSYGWLFPSAAVMDYDGDEFNTTTLNHNLWMVGIAPNVTIADVMDLGNDLNCAEYV